MAQSNPQGHCLTIALTALAKPRLALLFRLYVWGQVAMIWPLLLRSQYQDVREILSISTFILNLLFSERM